MARYHGAPIDFSILAEATEKAANWLHCPLTQESWVAPGLVGILLALTAGILVRTLFDLRHPVEIGDFAETERNETEWLMVAALTTLFWAVLAAFMWLGAITTPLQWAPWLQITLGFAGCALMLRALLRLQINMYTRPRNSSLGIEGEDSMRTASDMAILTTQFVARPGLLGTGQAGNLPGLLLGAMMVGLAVMALRTTGLCT